MVSSEGFVWWNGVEGQQWTVDRMRLADARSIPYPSVRCTTCFWLSLIDSMILITLQLDIRELVWGAVALS